MPTETNGTASESAVGQQAVGNSAHGTSVGPGTAKLNVPRRQGARHFDSIVLRLRTRMQDINGSGYLLGVTGCQRKSGVSTVAANLAIRAADHGMAPTLLIDANFAKPKQHRLVRANASPGLVEVLTGDVAAADAIQTTDVPGLSLLAAGHAGALEHSGVDYDFLQSLVKELRYEYRLLVFDLPEIGQLEHGLLFAEQLDGALMVVRANAARRRDAQVARSRLAADGVDVLGAVVTGQKHHAPQWLRRWV